MEIIIKGREYRRDKLRVSVNLMEDYSFQGMVRYRIYEEFWGRDGKVNKILRGVYYHLSDAKIEYKRILNNVERTLPVRELDLATY